MNGLSNVNVFENMIDLALSLGSPLRLIVLAALIGGCSTTRTWSPAVTLPFESLAPVSVSAMSAELEFDAIADGQRLKLDGVWVSEGPDRFRLSCVHQPVGWFSRWRPMVRRLPATMRGRLSSFKGKPLREVLIYCYRWHP